MGSLSPHKPPTAHQWGPHPEMLVDKKVALGSTIQRVTPKIVLTSGTCHPFQTISATVCMYIV